MVMILRENCDHQNQIKTSINLLTPCYCSIITLEAQNSRIWDFKARSNTLDTFIFWTCPNDFSNIIIVDYQISIILQKFLNRGHLVTVSFDMILAAFLVRKSFGRLQYIPSNQNFLFYTWFLLKFTACLYVGIVCWKKGDTN